MLLLIILIQKNVSAVDTVLGTWKPVHYKEVISKDDGSSKGDVAEGGETGKRQ